MCFITAPPSICHVIIICVCYRNIQEILLNTRHIAFVIKIFMGNIHVILLPVNPVF